MRAAPSHRSGDKVRPTVDLGPEPGTEHLCVLDPLLVDLLVEDLQDKRLADQVGGADGQQQPGQVHEGLLPHALPVNKVTATVRSA
jgi:hypothetical protein